jgi:hypothetical protein
MLRIGKHFVLTRAAAPLSSRLDRPNGGQENQRIRDRGQARLAHTCDSISESLKGHLCLRYRRLSARGAAGYDCGRAQVQLVLLVYLDEMVPCVREPSAWRGEQPAFAGRRVTSWTLK